MSFSSSLFDKIDGYFDGQKPHQVLRTTLASVVGAYYGYYALKEVQRVGFKKAIVAKIVGVAGKVVPGVDSKIRAEVDKEIQNLHNQFLGRCDQKTGQQLTVPTKGRSEKELLSLMVTWKDKEHSLWNGDNKVSGCVYHGGATLKQFQAKVMALFISSNPLHPTTFPFVRRMEAEVVSMCKNLFHGGAESCGVMSSGGTESILLAIHAYKEWALERGIEYPEVIKPSSAHPAFDKAAHYFGVKLVVVPVNQTTFTVDLADVRKAINKNTIALIGSAVNYPYGTLDDIEGLSKLAVDNNLGLHVDCCLGSILIAYMPKLGYPDHLFDFRLPGVTSISCDTHKYGFTPKGSSVIMWSRPELRRHHYYIIKNWPGTYTHVYKCIYVCVCV
jgi:sphinganine-1-phosphate aldolase